MPFELMASMPSTPDKTWYSSKQAPVLFRCGGGHTGARGFCCCAQQHGLSAAAVSCS